MAISPYTNVLLSNFPMGIFLGQDSLWKTIFLEVKVKVADPLDMNCHNPTYIDEYLTADI